MKITIKKFGTRAILAGAILFGAALTLGSQLSYSNQEIIGYTVIVVSLLFVYFGIKHFRDRENGGQVSFKKGLTVGLLISVCAGLGIGIVDGLYVSVINPDFFQQYSEAMMTTLKESGDTEKLAEMQKQMKTFESMSVPALGLFSGALMFVTVLLIGLVISLLSSLILKKAN